MWVEAWKMLSMSFLLLCQPIIGTAQKRPTSPLTKKVDALLKEIDAVHESHDHGSGHDHGATAHNQMAGMDMSGMNMAALTSANTSAQAVVAEKLQPQVNEAKSEGTQTPATEKIAVPATITVSQDATPAQSSSRSEIEKAKEQIKVAEIELAKLKELVAVAQVSPVPSDLVRIIELNKELITVFDKQIRDYRAKGVGYTDKRIQQARQNIRAAEQELSLYEKQLKDIKTDTSLGQEAVKKKVGGGKEKKKGPVWVAFALFSGKTRVPV